MSPVVLDWLRLSQERERLWSDRNSHDDNHGVAALHQPGELKLKGLQNVDMNTARFIRKLLVKDPADRWSAIKALQSQFFKIMDDTTRMAAAPAAIQEAMKNVSCEFEGI